MFRVRRNTPSHTALHSVSTRAVPAPLHLMLSPLTPSGGEGDLRACYTAMATAHLLGLDDDREELLRRSGMVDYVRRCQVGATGIREKGQGGGRWPR